MQRITIGSAKKIDLEAARTRAKALYLDKVGGKDPAAQLAETKQAAKAERSVPTLAQFLDTFLKDHVDIRLGQKTAYDYRRVCEKVLKPHLGDLKVDAVEAKHVAAMHLKLKDTPTQANQAVRILSSAMGKASEWGFRASGSNPAKIRLTGSRRRERLFSDAEVVRLQNTIDEMEAAHQIYPTVALGLKLLFVTGCRAGEICNLTWEGVKSEQGLFEWVEHKTATSSGMMRKTITKQAKELLEAAGRSDGAKWVCPSPSGKKMRVETLEAGFERVMKRAGVEAKENATLHLIRHWFATQIYSDPSIPLPVQMQIVGHKSVATAMRYAHSSKESVAVAAQAAEKKRVKALADARQAGKVVSLHPRPGDDL